MPCGWEVWFLCGWQVKLCDPLVTHGPYLSALEIGHNKALNSPSLLLYSPSLDSCPVGRVDRSPHISRRGYAHEEQMPRRKARQQKHNDGGDNEWKLSKHGAADADRAQGVGVDMETATTTTDHLRTLHGMRRMETFSESACHKFHKTAKKRLTFSDRHIMTNCQMLGMLPII